MGTADTSLSNCQNRGLHYKIACTAGHAAPVLNSSLCTCNLCVSQSAENLVRSKATVRQLSVSRMCTCVHCQTYRPWQRWCMRLCQ